MILFCKSLTLTENNFAFFSSGLVFCYACIVKYLRKYGKVGDLFPYHYWYLFFPVSSDKPAKQRGTAGQNLCEWVTLVVTSVVGAHKIQRYCKAEHFIWRGLKSEHLRTPGIVKGNNLLSLVWFKWGSEWWGILKHFAHSRCILISHWSREK